jgi:hypothetical protein
MEGSQMTDRKKIVYLRTALKNLAQSADRYIEDGSWIEHLSLDIEFAKGILKTTKPQKEQMQ